jgi:hypothetical protein
MKSPEKWTTAFPVEGFARTLFQATLSTLTIGAVALIVFAIRKRGFQWAEVSRIVSANRSLFAMIFLGLLIWDYWFQRTKRHRASK